MFALTDFPLVQPGDDVFGQIAACLERTGESLHDGDVLVIAQKVISKAEGRYAALSEVAPSPEAEALATEVDKDPRLVQLILDESVAVLRKRPGAVIVEHRLGYVHANAGIDQSNIPGNDQVLLLPKDSDASAAQLRAAAKRHFGADVNIIINDSAGRAWRNGTLGFAIGTAGFEPVEDRIGERDLFERELQVTTVAVADELAAGASFLMGQGNEGRPVVVIRGAVLRPADCGSSPLIRDPAMDMFR